MIRTVIFDLAEVLIAGLWGVENDLADLFGVTAEDIIANLGGEIMDDYCRGRMSEEEYWQRTIRRCGWPAHIERAKAAVRSNFRRTVPGSESIVRELAGQRYRVCLLSDHGREWIDFVRTVHPLLDLFDRRFFSFDLDAVKREPVAFERMLSQLDADPGECLFIDDQDQNLRVAREVGLTGVRFTGADDLRGELIRLGIRCNPPAIG